MTTKSEKWQSQVEKENAILRHMLSTPPKPHKVAKSRTKNNKKPRRKP
jgi:hypothetical protein